MFSRRGEAYKVNMFLLPFTGGPEGIVASGSISSCADRWFTVDFRSILVAATSVYRPRYNTSTFMLRDASKHLRQGTFPGSDGFQAIEEGIL